MASSIQLEGLQTEGRNENSRNIDQVDTLELCDIINNEDATIAVVIRRSVPVIAQAIDALEPKTSRGGRVVYVGAGTSGRLGVLDASEIPPTFSTSSEQFVALIAGGYVALRHAQEGAEDDVLQAEEDLKALDLDPDLDSLVGIAASGRTPYVLSCLNFAKSLGCITVGIACSEPSAMSRSGTVDHMISLVTGPEVVSGSTRMKAGTATKLVLNMLSTALMIKAGKTYGNMMIDLKATNQKLKQRSRNIIRSICGTSCPNADDDLDEILAISKGSVKLAVAMILFSSSADEAAKRLENARGVLSQALRNKDESKPGYMQEKSPLDSEFVLCIDGGGSKCAAVLLSRSGLEGRGEAGACNASGDGIEVAVSSISLAIRRSFDSCPATCGKAFSQVVLKRIWVGIAGYDRPNVARSLDSALAKLFGRPLGNSLRVSTDIDLLVSPCAHDTHLDSIIVLVAGTGSVAMNYTREQGQFIRTGRYGGWGHILGDDGSGVDIGRAALRLALEAADQMNLSQRSRSKFEIDPLARRIFEHFEAEGETGARVELLDQILSGNQQNLAIKRRIADVSKIVFDTITISNESRRICEAGVQSLMRLLSSLLANLDIDALRSGLVLAGGLMQNKSYQRMLLDTLASSGQSFRHVQIVDQPARAAAKHMLQEV